MPKFKFLDKVRVAVSNEDTRFYYGRTGTISQVIDKPKRIGYIVELEHDDDALRSTVWFEENELEKIDDPETLQLPD